jgi:uncharacterized protein YicC (UPF0701 family)
MSPICGASSISKDRYDPFAACCVALRSGSIFGVADEPCQHDRIFADGHGAHDGLRWRWEAKSVNGRSLELRLRTPPGLDGIEPAARALAAERFRRGNIQATLTLEPQEGARGLRVDPAALAAAVRIARKSPARRDLRRRESMGCWPSKA